MRWSVVSPSCRSLVCLSLLAGLGGCAKNKSGPPAEAGAVATGSAPAWVLRAQITNEEICGLGVAGAGYDANSPYPKEMASERGIRNLAGMLETNVDEAIIDSQTSSGQDIEVERALRIDEDLIEKVKGLAKVDFWLDTKGDGPFAQKNFTYANCCVKTADVATTLKLDSAKLAKSASKKRESNPDKVPRWINDHGRKPDGRLCSVGFSAPMFFADKTFEAVVEDVRGQLALVLETLVSQYSEELTNNRNAAYETMTVASTQAIAKGVIVTSFWFDNGGIGPFKQKHTTYGRGCVYPMDVIKSSIKALEQKAAVDPNTIAKVKQRAERAFEDLDAEIAKRDAAKGAP